MESAAKKKELLADERREVGEELLEEVSALTVYDMSEQLYRDVVAVIRRVCRLENDDE